MDNYAFFNENNFGVKRGLNMYLTCFIIWLIFEDCCLY